MAKVQYEVKKKYRLNKQIGLKFQREQSFTFFTPSLDFIHSNQVVFAWPPLMNKFYGSW